MQKGIILLAISLILGNGCRKKENSPALLFVYPETNYFTVKSFDVLEFEIRGSSGTYLEKFTVKSRPENGVSVTVFDTSLNTPNLSLIYQYLVPMVEDITKITIEFDLNDDAGNQTRIAKVLTVSPTIKLPVETAGHEMFSSLSGKQNAYDLSAGNPVFSTSSTSAEQQIKDDTKADTIITVDTLSRKWTSPGGLNFVRFNDFDYANATHNDMKQAYETGVKKTFVEQVNTGDIILSRLPGSEPDSGYLALKLVYIIDDDSTNFDRYIFNIKK